MSVWAGFQDNSYKLISMCLDGPETPTIMGPTVAQAGDNVTLTCNASSNPPSNYTWLFNDTVVANMSEYVTPPLTVNMSGMYSCMAYNNITGGYSSVYTILIVHGECSRTLSECSRTRRTIQLTWMFAFVCRYDKSCTSRSTRISSHRRPFVQPNVPRDWTC